MDDLSDNALRASDMKAMTRKKRRLCVICTEMNNNNKRLEAYRSMCMYHLSAHLCNTRNIKGKSFQQKIIEKMACLMF